MVGETDPSGSGSRQSVLQIFSLISQVKSVTKIKTRDLGGSSGLWSRDRASGLVFLMPGQYVRMKLNNK